MLFGKRNSKGRDSVFTFHTDRAAMQLDDALYDGKTDAVALACVGFISLIEFAEYLLQLVLRYFTSRVADLHEKVISFFEYFKLYRTATRNEFYCIIDKIYPYILE